ncbi:MAG: response regulator [Methanobacteriota archaeon]
MTEGERGPAIRLLLVDRDRAFLSDVRGLLATRLPLLHVMTAETPVEALALLERHSADMIVAGERLSRIDGAAFLRLATAVAPRSVRVLTTDDREDDAVREAAQEPFVHALLVKAPGPAALAEKIRGLIDARVRGLRS